MRLPYYVCALCVCLICALHLVVIYGAAVAAAAVQLHQLLRASLLQPPVVCVCVCVWI